MAGSTGLCRGSGHGQGAGGLPGRAGCVRWGVGVALQSGRCEDSLGRGSRPEEAGEEASALAQGDRALRAGAWGGGLREAVRGGPGLSRGPGPLVHSGL